MSAPDHTSEYSAGGVVYKTGEEGCRIAVVKRARHDDWSLPKGHIEPGESLEQTALREVKEETGLDARIVCPLDEIVYFFTHSKKGLVRKTVHHFLMEATSADLGGPNWEVSEVCFVPIAEARSLLTYENDRQVVGKAGALLGDGG